MQTISLLHTVLLAAILFLTYNLLLILYRLFLHPLSSYPGPKLTAITYLVEYYYELFHQSGGQFPLKYREWHDQYGPIIRVNPDEIHIRDSSWYETLFDAKRPVRKQKDFAYRLNNEGTAFGTEDPTLYRERRSALNPFFSKRKVGEHTAGIRDRIERLLLRLEEEYLGEGTVLNVTKMWECFASDNVVSFCFDRNHGFIDSEGFVSGINEGVMNMTEKIHWMSFNWITWSTRIMPGWVVLNLMPELRPVFEFWKAQEAQINSVVESHANGEKLSDTLFSSLLENGAGSQDQQGLLKRLHAEARAVVGAGSETTARTLTLATLHILDQPAVHNRLRAELQEAMPDTSAATDWNLLQRLPYLSACIEEALRLSYGLSERRARAYDGGTLIYSDGQQEWPIPPGTFMSMDNFDISHDEAIFPASFDFRPERWLQSDSGELPKAPDGKQLSRYMISFGKGMRNCIGMHFAYAQLGIALATFFRSEVTKGATLYESSKLDVEMAMCRFVPRPRKESKGVRLVLNHA